MDASQFADRMELIRKRFSARLPKKIEETEAAFPILAGHGGDAAAAVATVYRRFHEVCGIGPTVGFNEVGRIARTLVDGVLVKPSRALTRPTMRLFWSTCSFRTAMASA